MSEAFITFDQEIITIEDIEKVAKSGRFVVIRFRQPLRLIQQKFVPLRKI